jgi:hypothetical protein
MNPDEINQAVKDIMEGKCLTFALLDAGWAGEDKLESMDEVIAFLDAALANLAADKDHPGLTGSKRSFATSLLLSLINDRARNLGYELVATEQERWDKAMEQGKLPESERITDENAAKINLGPKVDD